MKKIIPFVIACSACIASFAQPGTETDKLRETARTLMQQGDFDNATQVLDKALQSDPENIELLKDIAFVCNLNRDYARALEVGKKITESPNADVQSFQILGNTYAATADFKDADKMYRAALKKFPSSGVLYSEYGNILNESNNKSAAIKQWEKGIETDPNISSNYYYATKHYWLNDNLIWALVYGETFINLESLSPRTNELKTMLFEGYKKLYYGIDNIKNNKAITSPFEKAVANDYGKLSGQMTDLVTPDALISLRTRFILNWYELYAGDLPNRLFDQQRMMLQQGLFPAYNQWIFGALYNKDAQALWNTEHADEVQAFQQFQRGTVFKIPTGQYYAH